MDAGVNLFPSCQPGRQYSGMERGREEEREKRKERCREGEGRRREERRARFSISV